MHPKSTHFDDTTAMRDLRHTILTAVDHRCHYCGTNAHQIHQTLDEQWVALCRQCLRNIGYHTFPTESAKFTYLSTTTKPQDSDMILLKAHLERAK